MSGIPVYTQSPISASKAAGVTPQTAVPEVQTTPLAPSTATASATTSYPPARPGAAPPAPTGTSAGRYAPTPTATAAPDGPPVPQPGAVPTLKSTIPPPPKAGEKYQYYAPQVSEPPRAESQSYPHQFPPQMTIPPPTGAYGAQPPASSTSTTNNPSTSYPVPISSPYDGAPRRSLEHPQGYHQNVYASVPNSDQRRAQEAAANASRHDPGDAGADEGNGIWDTAKKFALQAGEAVAKAEAEVWKRVNKD